MVQIVEITKSTDFSIRDRGVILADNGGSFPIFISMNQIYNLEECMTNFRELDEVTVPVEELFPKESEYFEKKLELYKEQIRCEKFKIQLTNQLNMNKLTISVKAKISEELELIKEKLYEISNELIALNDDYYKKLYEEHHLNNYIHIPELMKHYLNEYCSNSCGGTMIDLLQGNDGYEGLFTTDRTVTDIDNNKNGMYLSITNITLDNLEKLPEYYRDIVTTELNEGKNVGYFVLILFNLNVCTFKELNTLFEI